jgi:hypothetical protein
MLYEADLRRTVTEELAYFTAATLLHTYLIQNITVTIRTLKIEQDLRFQHKQTSQSQSLSISFVSFGHTNSLEVA